jgi:hypothetical protein
MSFQKQFHLFTLVLFGYTFTGVLPLAYLSQTSYGLLYFKDFLQRSITTDPSEIALFVSSFVKVSTFILIMSVLFNLMMSIYFFTRPDLFLDSNEKSTP